MPLAQLSTGFQSLPPLPTIKSGPSSADSRVGGFVYILGPCGSLQQTLLWGWGFLPLPQSPQVFSLRGLRLYFPTLEPWVGWSVLLPSCSSRFNLHVNVGPPSPPAAALPWVLSTQLPVSVPPAGLGECFFFDCWLSDFHTVWFFCQFWLLFVFKFVVVLLLVMWRGTVCLTMPPSWPEVYSVNLSLDFLKNSLSMTNIYVIPSSINTYFLTLIELILSAL